MKHIPALLTVPCTMLSIVPAITGTVTLTDGIISAARLALANNPRHCGMSCFGRAAPINPEFGIINLVYGTKRCVSHRFM